VTEVLGINFVDSKC